jgi:hypothetical protein
MRKRIKNNNLSHLQHVHIYLAFYRRRYKSLSEGSCEGEGRGGGIHTNNNSTTYFFKTREKTSSGQNTRSIEHRLTASSSKKAQSAFSLSLSTRTALDDNPNTLSFGNDLANHNTHWRRSSTGTFLQFVNERISTSVSLIPPLSPSPSRPSTP